jgi:methylglutamate dehydrogenase subunit D
MVSFAQAERFPLHGIAQAGRHGRLTGAAGLAIEVRTDLALVSVIAKRNKLEGLKTAVSTTYGVALPDGPRRLAAGLFAFAGVGPDQWLASAEGAEAAGFASRLRGRIGLFAAVTDQSDARLVLQLSGARVREVLAKGVPVDLHPKAFKLGDVANTVVAHIGVQIEMLDAAPMFQLTTPRSTAGSFWSWLTASAAELGYEVVMDRATSALP